MRDNNEYLYSVQSRKEIRSKRKRKEKMEFSGEGKGSGGISIHPGPGELVLQGHHPLEVQNLPAYQARKGIRVNDLNGVFKNRQSSVNVGVDGWVMHGRLPLLHRECPLSC